MSASVNYAKLRVLVVEDETYTSNLICRLLRQVGVEFISTATNGKDGLMETVRTRPGIVFCDVHMAPMNGKQFLQGVRSIKVKDVDKTAVVFLTGDSDADTVNFAIEHHVNGYLVKPVSLSRLKDAIDKVVASDPGLLERMTP